MERLTLSRAIKMAVATEELGAKYYREIAKKFSSDIEVARIFKQLSEDEVAHETQFRKLLEEVPPEEEVAEQGDAGLLLRAAAMSQFFDKKAIEDFATIETPTDALAKALAFERSTLFYYQSLKEVLGESPQLQEMIDSEKAHVTGLMKVILSEARFRGLADP